MMDNNLIDFIPVNDRICKIRLKTSFYNITMVSVHAPTEEKELDVKEEFYAHLERVTDSIPNYDMKITLGDFNVQVGKSLHDETNDNGMRMVDFASGKDMAVTGTWFQHKNIHKGTWTSPDKKTINQIDHILVDRRHCSNVCDVRTRRGANIEPDHFLVCMKLRLKLKTNSTGNTKGREVEKWNIQGGAKCIVQKE
ncbi:hypothetical protein C0J52_09600 [Blattella germanica]|nr:hypothetical protein C0J52_09600 [Blattella germanica]